MTTTSTGQPHRAHLDGLRAVAVVLVIAFHLGYGWLPGGFIGVDVFFVLSGYLISGLLVDELVRSGRVGLARFYARRVRRLLPAAVLVVVVVIVGTVGLLDRVDQAAVGHDATFAALYGANWHFGLGASDYFAPGDVPSPLIHFWSLAVEEQFYLVWPALLLGLWAASKAARRRGASGMGVLLVAVLALAGTSVAMSLLLHPGPLTYYGTHTRAYQLLAGAALAIAARRRSARPGGARWSARPPGAAAGSARLRASGALLSATALAALCLLAHGIHEARDYPGVAGIAVTCASVALIGSLDLMGDHPLRRAAGAALPAGVGRLSYSLYLWHWPTIVFLPLLARRHDVPSLASRPALIAAMTLLALTSYRLWEQPLRFGALSRRVVVAGLAASVALAALSIAILRPPSGFESRALASVADMAAPGPCPYFGRDWPAPADSRACVRRRGRGLTIALVGDSHAHQWQPALDLLAARRDLTVIRATRGGCPANDVTVDRADALGLNGSGAECTAWRHRVYADLVTRYDPDVVFVATRGHVSAVLDGNRRIAPFTPEHRRRWSAAWNWTLRTLGARGASVVVSRILPTLPQRVPACLASAGRPSHACDFPVGVDRRVGAYNAIVDRLVRRGPRIAIFDPTPIGCPGGTCRAMSGDVVVHRDDNHLSATFVRSRTAQFGAGLARSLATLGRRAPAGARALSMR